MLRRLAVRAWWWLDERRMPWCETCQMRHVIFPDWPAKDVVRAGNSLRTLIYEQRETP